MNRLIVLGQDRPNRSGDMTRPERHVKEPRPQGPRTFAVKVRETREKKSTRDMLQSKHGQDKERSEQVVVAGHPGVAMCGFSLLVNIRSEWFPEWGRMLAVKLRISGSISARLKRPSSSC